jgi:hypothetical protein
MYNCVGLGCSKCRPASETRAIFKFENQVLKWPSLIKIKGAQMAAWDC